MIKKTFIYFCLYIFFGLFHLLVYALFLVVFIPIKLVLYSLNNLYLSIIIPRINSSIISSFKLNI